MLITCDIKLWLHFSRLPQSCVWRSSGYTSCELSGGIDLWTGQSSGRLEVGRWRTGWTRGPQSRGCCSQMRHLKMNNIINIEQFKINFGIQDIQANSENCGPLRGNKFDLKLKRSMVKVTAWCQWKGLVTRITHAKWSMLYHNTSEDMSHVKVSVTEGQTDKWVLMSPTFAQVQGTKITY